MRRFRFVLVVLYAALGLIVPIAGCASSPPEAHGYQLDVPTGWKPMEHKDVVVPGRPLQAWSISGGGSMVIFRQIKGPITAQQLLTLTLNQCANQPGWTIDEHEVRKIDGLESMWITVTGWGDGGSLVPTPTGEDPSDAGDESLVRTRRLWLAVLRSDNVLSIQLHCRADQHAEIRPAVDRMIASLRWDGT